MGRRRQHKISQREAWGLIPLGPSLKQCWKAIAGDKNSPPTKWDFSSVKIFDPKMGIRTWLGKFDADGRVPVVTLFNHNASPRGEAYDVRTTNVRDFRGGKATYNGHIGTDFAVPVGTTVTAPAEGIVRIVENLMYRGGLKIVIDHGDGLITMPSHMARATVSAGQKVERGEVIGLSGYSGVDGILAFPWVAPHVHFTVMQNGVAVDPFGFEDNASIWRNGPSPVAADIDPTSPALIPTRWDENALEAVRDSCRDAKLKAHLKTIDDSTSLRMRSATSWAIWIPVSGKMTANSSPP